MKRKLLLQLMQCAQQGHSQDLGKVLDDINLQDDIALKMRSEYLLILHDMSTAKTAEDHEKVMQALRECVESIEALRTQFKELGLEMDFYDDFSATAMAQTIANARQKTH